MRSRLLAAALALVSVACAQAESSPGASPDAATAAPTTTATSAPELPATSQTTTTASPPTDPPTTAAPTTTAPTTTTTVAPRAGVPAPVWLGTRVLPLQPGSPLGEIQPTPPELVDRMLWTVDLLPPPSDDTFVSEVVHPPPADVIARSTWQEACPVTLDELAYAQVSFVGFDGWFHTGELLAHVDHIHALVTVFEGLHELRFPIEEMRVVTRAELDAPPTGDGNNTSAFVCRPAVGSTTWSRHAHGAALDLNPFHNPYVKGDPSAGGVLIPELASAYVDRTDVRPGMVTPEVEALFAGIGWGWGGDWSSSADWMHFSDNGG